jgi:hypothetical protein
MDWQVADPLMRKRELLIDRGMSNVFIKVSRYVNGMGGSYGGDQRT